MKKIKIFRRGLVYSFFVVSLFVSLFSQSVDAATRSFPDSSDFSGANPAVLVGVSSRGAGIDAKTSKLKLYSPARDAGVTIYDAHHCPGTSTQSTFDYGVIDSTSVTLKPNSGTGQVGIWNTGGCGSAKNQVLMVKHSGAKTKIGQNNYYVFDLTITANSRSLGFNGFRLMASPNGLIGYTDDGNSGFAIKPKFVATKPTNSTYTFRFAPSCDVTSNDTKKIFWKDADQGEGNQLGDISFDVYDETENKTILSVGPSGIGGQNSSKSRTVTFKPNHRYKWIWRNVSSNNGVQMQIPYDSIYYNEDCNYPVGSRSYSNFICGATPAGDSLVGAAQDYDRIRNPSRIPIEVRIDGQFQNWNGSALGSLSSTVVNFDGWGSFSKKGNVVPDGFRTGSQYTIKVSAYDYPTNKYVEIGSQKFTCPAPSVKATSDNRSDFDDAVSKLDGTKVTPGEEYDIGIKAWNAGTKSGLTFPIVSTDQPAAVEPVSITSTKGMQSELYHALGANSECLRPGRTGTAPECWAWFTRSMAPKTNSGTAPAKGKFRFRVKSDAATGTKICFSLFNKPRGDDFSSGNYFLQPRFICMEVEAKKSYPLAKIEGGDVHAGAVLSADVATFGTQACNVGSPDAADIIGGKGVMGYALDSDGYSSGEYGVFASGAIKNFGSNTKVYNSLPFNAGRDRALKFTNNDATVHGKYATICRPDLSATSNGAPVFTLNNASHGTADSNVFRVSIAQLEEFSNNHGKATRFVVRTPGVASGGAKTISISGGPVSDGKKMTIIADDSNVQITGNITYDGTYNSRIDIPSFALISAYDISVGAGVTNIAGFYSAIGDFDTCGGQRGALSSYEIDKTSSTLGGAACFKKLKVYGAVMAKRIYLRRTIGGLDVPSPLRGASNGFAETFTFAPELTISQPDLGEEVNTSVIRNGYQELPPVF